MKKDEVLETLKRELPPIWDRKATTRLTGGVVNSGSLANRMSEGIGPAGAFRHGKKIVIVREPFLEWLAARLEPIAGADR